MSKITERIAAQAGVPHLFELLSQQISPSDLQSLLLDVYRVRARRASLKPTPLTAPSDVDARVLNELDRAAFAAASSFDAIELSPLGPLGVSQILGGIDQNNVVTTIRNAEVLGDSTEALALEAARRRKLDRSRAVRLASSHRVVRMQPFDVPGFTPHFRLFTLVSAFRGVEYVHLAEHIRVYLTLCRLLNECGFSLRNPLVEVSDLRVTESLLAEKGISRDAIRAAVRAHRPGSSQRFLANAGIELPESAGHPAIEQNIFDPLKREFPEAEFRVNLARLEGMGYYTGLCLRISPRAANGKRYAPIDGGFTNWTSRLLQDNKERLLTSGMGSEFVCRVYR